MSAHRVTFALICGVDAPDDGGNIGRMPAVEIPFLTMVAARDGMRALVGKTAGEALLSPGATPDEYDGETHSGLILAGFTIATYHSDYGTLAEIDFNKQARA